MASHLIRHDFPNPDALAIATATDSLKSIQDQMMCLTDRHSLASTANLIYNKMGHPAREMELAKRSAYLSAMLPRLVLSDTLLDMVSVALAIGLMAAATPTSAKQHSDHPTSMAQASGKAWRPLANTASSPSPDNLHAIPTFSFAQATTHTDIASDQPIGRELSRNTRSSNSSGASNNADQILRLLERSRILREAGKLEEALESIELAGKIAGQIEGDADVTALFELPVHMSRHNILTMLKRHDEALQSIKKVLGYFEIESISSLIKEDSSLFGAAPYNAYYKAAQSSKYIDIKRAPEFLNKGLDLLESSGFKNKEESEKIYLEYADLFAMLGWRQKAIEIYSMLGNRYINDKKLKESPKYAAILYSLADLRMIEGDFGLAELLLQGALTIYANNMELHWYEYQWTRVSLSKLRSRIDEALLILEEIEGMAYKDKNPGQVVRALSGQVSFAHHFGKASKLTQLFKRFDRLPKDYFSDELITSYAQDYLIILTALSENLIDAGFISEARDILDSAMAISLRELGTGNFLSLRAFMSLAQTDEHVDAKRAMAMYRRIAEISYENGLLIQTIDSLSRLSFLEAKNGNIAQAIREGQAHSMVYLEFLINTLPSLTREDRINTIGLYNSDLLHSLSSLHQPAIKAGLWAAINERGLLNHIEIQQSRSIQDGKKRDIAKRINELSSSTITDVESSSQDSLQEKRSAQLLLNQITPYRPTKRFFAINDLLDVLPEGSTYIHVIRYGKHSFKRESEPIDYYGAYVVSRSGLAFVDIGKAQDIDRIIVEARNGVASNLSDSNQKLHQVYERAVAPWIIKVQPNSEIYVSLDSEMNVVPIDSLYVDGFGERVLSDSYTIKVVSSPRDYVDGLANGHIARPSKPVVFANPAYAIVGNADPYSFRSQQKKDMPPRTRSWEALQYAGAEGALVSSTIKSTLYEKADASELNIKAVQSPLVLHVAAHAFFDPIEEDSVLTPSRSTRTPNTYERIEHYLYGSGIALAAPMAAGDSSGDGILTAAEASRLALSGTELVVLSACSTGDGVSTSGLGVFGLHRSFIEAGARSVLTSLWKVDDQSTAEFMNRFYTLIKKGKPRSEALRMVKKDFREGRVGNDQWKEPYYWAAWQLVGDWGPIPGL
jgi:tetratricopeptide (TPR) repeat protein